MVVAQSCKVVIACRARKDQKAKLTRLVRNGNREVVTLAIGDGANDVEMIRTAHIGVGVIGKEGTQAVNNADYAIGQFRFLTRLLLVYGHRNYRGITLAALLIFYKNILFTLVQYLYTFLCGLSGTRNQCFLAIMFYNTLFTAFGPFFIAVFDRDISDANLYRFPQIHRQGMDHTFFSVRLFLVVFLKALWESASMAFVVAYSTDTITYASGTVEMYMYGMINVTATIIVANLSCSFLQCSSSAISIVAFWLLLALWILGVALISQFKVLMPYYYKYVDILLFTPSTYLIVILAAAVAIIPSIIVKALFIEFRPLLTHIIQDVQLQHANPDLLKRNLEELEKNRSIEQELKTIKSLPENVAVPDWMYSPSSTEKEEETEIVQELPSFLGPSIRNHVNPAMMSIRSIAGMRALLVCDKLHGPYDSMSVDEESQLHLIQQINSHRWRKEETQGFFGQLALSF